MQQTQRVGSDDGRSSASSPRKKRPQGQHLTPRAAERAKRQFLQTLEETISVAQACRVAGIDRMTATHWRELDAEFAEAWQAALDAALDDLEHTAQQRAHNGSDLLLMFLLKANRPAKYRESVKHELTGDQGGPINVQFFTFNAVASAVVDASIGQELDAEHAGDNAVAAALTDGSAADR